MDLAFQKREAVTAIDAAREALIALSLRLHAHPETKYEEVYAHDELTAFFAERGFAVTRSAFGLDTAFTARAGRYGPTVALMCEYDALPGLGHACGHNLIAMAGAAAALGVAAALGGCDEGSVLAVGCPAEEGGGGKIRLLEAGAFAAVDAAMMVHPAAHSAVRPTLVAMRPLEVHFNGRSAHPTIKPWEGLNALDAMVLAFSALGLLRQQLRPEWKVHGVIVDGGRAPNIIPARTTAQLHLRAPDRTGLRQLERRVLACFAGAAEATGCRAEHHFLLEPYEEMAHNEPLVSSYEANLAELGSTAAAREALPMAPTTDMGNVSHVVPAIHPFFAIPCSGDCHTPEFQPAAASPEAHREALLAAKAMAMTAVEVVGSAAVRTAAQAAFETTHPGGNA